MKVKGAQNFCFSPSDIPDDHQSSYYWLSSMLISFIHFSCSVMSDSLWTHGLQQARLLCQSPTLGVYSNLCPCQWWCHPNISSCIIPFSSYLQSFPASESFQMSQLFASGGQRLGVSASTSVLPVNTQGWSPSNKKSLGLPWQSRG